MTYTSDIFRHLSSLNGPVDVGENSSTRLYTTIFNSSYKNEAPTHKIRHGSVATGLLIKNGNILKDTSTRADELSCLMFLCKHT